MKPHPFVFAFAIALGFVAGTVSAGAQHLADNPVATAPVYAPDTTHAEEPLPDGILVWDELLKSADATNEQPLVKFTYAFTNITPKSVTILAVRPSCGCTTAELPPVPWMIPAASNGVIKLTVNLQGKSGTLFKSVNISTDKGRKELMLRINIQPPPPLPKLTEEQRDANIAAARKDRQAVFKGDCASCHLRKIEGKYGQPLYETVCAICHESPDRIAVVPDLRKLQVTTTEEFWRSWITYGKPGSLMPAFATSQGGPLTDMQIASLAAYLNAVNPSKATNAPAAK
jgi:cytochrome c553